jgi:general secretion pathway protein C
MGERTETAGRPVEPAAQENARPLGFYQAIVDRNLFNTRRQTPPIRQEALDVNDLARTGLKVTLRGTVSGEVDRAYAVIEDDVARQQKLYRQGDEIQGAAIRLILREKVVLRVNGRDEILAMAKPEEGPKSSATNEKPRPEAESQAVQLKSEDITAALGDLYNLAQQATIRPNFNRGKRDGFLLARVQPTSVFSQLGLKTGDIIKSVNGEQITSVGQALNLYKNLTPGSQVEVLISRRGDERKLVFSIE